MSLPAHAASNPKEDAYVQATTPSLSIFNSRLAVQIGNDGRFNMGAFPDPATGGPTSNSWDLMYAWPSGLGTSFTTVRIDGIDNVYGTTGTQIEAPTNLNATTNESKWQIGDIVVTQTLELVPNNQTGQQDAAKITYSIHNSGSLSHIVGLRAMIDTQLNGNDGAVFRVPGIGLVTKETEFVGAEVPDIIHEFFNVTDSTHVAASAFKSNGATAPDRLILAGWWNLRNTAYDYTVDPNYDFTDSSVGRPDSAYAAYWNPTSLEPGAVRTYSTVYGLAELTGDLQPPLALGVTGPATLSVVNGSYSPNPFDVTATLLNNGTAAATNVQLTLNLPDGLTLATGSATQVLGDLAVGQERDVSWRVQAAAQSAPTTLTYSVTASAENAPSKTVERTITLPTYPNSTCDITWIYETSGMIGFDPVGVTTTPNSGCHVSLEVNNPLLLWQHYTIDPSPGVVLTEDPSTSFYADLGLLPPASRLLGTVPIQNGSVKYHADFTKAGDTIRVSVDQTEATRQLNTADLIMNLIPGVSGDIASHSVEFYRASLESLSDIQHSYAKMPHLQAAANDLFGPNPNHQRAMQNIREFATNPDELQAFVDMVDRINERLERFKFDVSVTLLKKALLTGPVGFVASVTSPGFYLMFRLINHYSSLSGWVQVNTYSGPNLRLNLPPDILNRNILDPSRNPLSRGS